MVKSLDPSRIKICGITRREDAEAATDIGFTALGFILYEKSPRFIQPDVVRDITYGLSPFIRRIGVTVNAPLEFIDGLWCKGIFDMFQIHGDESSEYCRQLSQKGIPFYKAFRVEEGFDFACVKDYPGKGFLFDAYSDNEYGGSGRQWDWEDMRSLSVHQFTVIAGGLHAGNILTAHRITHADAYDISSGVEHGPGIKSVEKLRALYQTIL
ncbi:hypothetical protein CHS0354_035337 [Potamilus streckersoni]|uniref:phosphoribosylanthranilate isomerase n=1 Tax=Potamilus streckersoni TaxID=2493646 RepID=A0AAE0S2N5_9BIVA|nr:hypothetical protein CHS0354_035337 [Potamilus streckersoni]